MIGVTAILGVVVVLAVVGIVTVFGVVVTVTVVGLVVVSVTGLKMIGDPGTGTSSSLVIDI